MFALPIHIISKATSTPIVLTPPVLVSAISKVNRVELNWTDLPVNPLVTGYEIESNIDSTGWSNIASVGLVLTYDDTEGSLEDSSVIEYRLKSRQSFPFPDSGYSNIKSVTII